MNHVPVSLQTVLLLAASNVFMTFAWYGHLKHLSETPWVVAALASWGIALFEYLLQVPANRIGFAGGVTVAQLKIMQLKIMQEVITLGVFVPFAVVPTPHATLRADIAMTPRSRRHHAVRQAAAA